MRPHSRSQRVLVGCIAALAMFIAASPAPAAGPNELEIKRAIDRAVAYLKRQQTSAYGGSGADSLRAYALLRAGEPADGPVVAPVIQRILSKCGSNYNPRTQHIYTAAVDLMALEAANAELYGPQIQLIVDYLISKQNPNGSWDYVDQNRQQGDTSQTQYALLGLWAAARAGFTIPASVWDGAARWHIATQLNGGGFAYHPLDSDKALTHDHRIPRHTMTAAGVGSLHICRLFLAPGATGRGRSPLAIQPTRKFGILEPVDLDGSPDQPGPQQSNVSSDRPGISRSQIDAAIERGTNWLTANYAVKINRWQLYYLYTIERLGALADTQTIGDHDWYAEGAAFLIGTQMPDGSWNDNSGPAPATSFGVLFLQRATSKLLNRERPAKLGGGLLAGGRGLPENLSEVQVQDGKVAARKPSGPIDELLAELERPNELRIEAAQTAIVEQVQLGEREELIGQTERLKKLAADPRVEVRRTALWALGHTGDLRVAPLLIEALKDPSLAVNIEARNALCTLSRNPLGFGLADDPLQEIPEDASAEQREAALRKWRDEAYRKWRDWYLTVRPYDERDDLTRLRIAR